MGCSAQGDTLAAGRGFWARGLQRVPPAAGFSWAPRNYVGTVSVFCWEGGGSSRDLL